MVSPSVRCKGSDRKEQLCLLNPVTENQLFYGHTITVVAGMISNNIYKMGHQLKEGSPSSMTNYSRCAQNKEAV